MITIYKYPVKITEEFSLQLPKDADILSVQMQNGMPFIWAWVETDFEPETRTFAVYGTGHPIVINDIEVFSHVGTFQDGMYVWHLFEIATTKS